MRQRYKTLTFVKTGAIEEGITDHEFNKAPERSSDIEEENNLFLRSSPIPLLILNTRRVILSWNDFPWKIYNLNQRKSKI